MACYVNLGRFRHLCQWAGKFSLLGSAQWEGQDILPCVVHHYGGPVGRPRHSALCGPPLWWPSGKAKTFCPLWSTIMGAQWEGQDILPFVVHHYGGPVGRPRHSALCGPPLWAISTGCACDKVCQGFPFRRLCCNVWLRMSVIFLGNLGDGNYLCSEKEMR